METGVEHTRVKEKGKLPTIKMDFFGIIASEHGVSYRSYAEFVDNKKPNIPALKDHFCPTYHGLGFIFP